MRLTLTRRNLSRQPSVHRQDPPPRDPQSQRKIAVAGADVQQTLSSARPEEGGLASGIVNTSYQIGSALGLAALTAVAAANGADKLGNLTSLSNGYSAAFIGATVIAAAGAVLAAITLRKPTSSAKDGDAAAEPVTGTPASR